MLRILIVTFVSILFYLASTTVKPAFADGTVLNAAALGQEAQGNKTQIAPGSIATFRGSSLALKTETSFEGAEPPFKLAGSTVTVAAQPARMFYASPNEVVFVVPESLAIGLSEIVVTNADGLMSKAEALIAAAAPGVFTVSANGRGEGIILDADTLLSGPFDPSNGQRRLSIFATGVKHATSVLVTIGGEPTVVETVGRSNVAGIDEIHLLLPTKLSGAGA